MNPGEGVEHSVLRRWFPYYAFLDLIGFLRHCTLKHIRFSLFLKTLCLQGDRETFENYYRKQRKKQARLVLQPQANMHETVDGYRRYFNQIVGFFVVEDHILHATRGLVTRAFTDELWNMALSKIIAVLRTHS
ncbi:Exocyst complex component 6, partial [Goodea atripinnis]